MFSPLWVGMPFAGSINYFRNGEGGGAAVLVLAVRGLVLTLVISVAVTALALRTFTFVGFQRITSNLRSRMAEFDTGFPAGAAQVLGE